MQRLYIFGWESIKTNDKVTPFTTAAIKIAATQTKSAYADSV